MHNNYAAMSKIPKLKLLAISAVQQQLLFGQHFGALSHHEQLVFLALADLCDQDGSLYCAELAGHPLLTTLSTATIARAIAKLKKLGMLVGHGRGRKATYQLLVD